MTEQSYAIAVPKGYTVGPWEVRTLLASGAFSTVYAARRTGTPAEGLPDRAALRFLPTGTRTPRQLRHLRELAVPVDRGAAGPGPDRPQACHQLVHSGQRCVELAAQAGLAQPGKDREVALRTVQGEGRCGQRSRESVAVHAAEGVVESPDIEGEQIARRGKHHPRELERHRRVQPARRDLDVLAGAFRVSASALAAAVTGGTDCPPPEVPAPHP